MPVPELLLAVAVLFGGLWIYGKSSGLTFFGDDWEFILGRRGISTGTLLIPHNGHLSLAPVVIYKTLFATVGLDDYGPYRAVLVLLHCLAAVLLYVLLRRRTGSWVALAGALVLLFLGSAGETLIYPFTMNFVGAIAFGLAALVALDRGDRVGDVVACAALLVSLSFSGVGLPFVVAALVELSLDRPRRRALWVALIPLVFLAGWTVKYGDGGPSLANLDVVSSYVAQQNARTVAALVGLPAEGWGALLALAAVVLVALSLKDRRPAPRLVAMIAASAVFWVLTALFRGQLGLDGNERYIYPGAVLLLLILAEVVGFQRPPLPAVVAGCVVLAGALAANVGALDATAAKWSLTSSFVRADLGAMELARNRLPGDYQPPLQAWGLTASQYFDVRDKWGTPALAPRELERLPDLVARSADAVVQVGVSPRPAGGGAQAGAAPQLGAVSGGRASTRGGCLLFRARQADANVEVVLPATGIRATNLSSQNARVLLRRFAPDYSNPAVGVVAPHSTGELAISADASPSPWRVRLDSPGRLKLCAAGA